MPPSLSPSLLKAVTVPFHHHHPPVIYGIKNPSHMLGRSSLPRSLNEVAIKRTAATPGIINGIAGRGGRKGAARFAGEGWWMGSGSGLAPFPMAADEWLTGGRRWAGGGPARAGGGGGGGWSSDGRVGGDETQEQVVGSLLQYQQNEEGGVEDNGSCKKDQPQDSPRLLTLPTVLTLGRVAAVPLLVTTYHMNAWWATTATTSIFLAAAFTDWLDGYIARKMRLGTAFGAFLDPVADKLMVATTLILLCTKPLEVSIFGDVPWILTVPSIAIIGREITMSAVREWAASQNSTVLEAVAVNNLGKWKTATQMTALTLLLAARDPSLTGSAAVVASGVLLLYISAGLAVWSLVVYMSKIWRILLK